MDVYINDIIVKYKRFKDHVELLMQSFERIKRHQLKLKSPQCAFEICVRNFLGFLVHQRQIKVDHNRSKDIIVAKVPQTRKSSKGSWAR